MLQEQCFIIIFFSIDHMKQMICCVQSWLVEK